MVTQLKNSSSPQYWLMKSEPNTYSISDLQKDKTTFWDGVRNYQARNFMTNQMEKGDIVFFYHSNAKPSGVVGIAEVSQKAVADSTAFDKESKYYDLKSSKEKPRWFCVEIKYKKTLKRMVSLEEIKSKNQLQKMVLVNNSRLSVQPVKKSEFDFICKMSEK